MSDLIFRLVPETSRINPIFLQAQISLPSQRRKISEMSGGAAGSMPNVSKAKLRDFQIIIPRLETQMEFARIVQSYRASWAHHAQSLKYSDFLFSSLQSRAFSGQL
jgi:type I restriction enzyme S subunit